MRPQMWCMVPLFLGAFKRGMDRFRFHCCSIESENQRCDWNGQKVPILHVYLEFHGSEAALHSQFWGKGYLAESLAEGQFFCT